MLLVGALWLSFGQWRAQAVTPITPKPAAPAAPLATFVVDRTDDANVSACTAAANDCTLRGAINKANAGGGNNSITFDATVFAAPRKTINTSLPAITGNLSISAPVAGVVLKGPGGSGVTIGSVITIGPSMNVMLTGLTITGGVNNQGSGVNNAGALSLNNCTVHDNRAGTQGSIFNKGSDPDNNDFNAGRFFLTNCTLSGNFAGQGAVFITALPRT